MRVTSSDYPRRAAETISENPAVRTAVTDATLAFEESRVRAWAEIDAEAWRTWASQVKDHLLTHLDQYLVEAEDRLTENGATVHWASDAQEALAILDEIVDRHGVQRVVKAKSMLSEELGVNDHLEARGVEPIETDLGEYIIQLLDEPPSHIVGPAIHRSLQDVRELFHERLGTPLDADPDVLASAAQQALRESFLSADMGISGGNFLVAETGTLALIENEGNIRLSTSAPPVHVAFVGIEKLLPRWDDLSTFLELTSRSATGQPVGCFVSLLQGPALPAEPDGPKEMHVVLVDNGRTRLLADDEAWAALRCVRCGSCLNVCPVYRQTGGHAYGWVYSGPIGAILAPSLLGLEAAMPLPFASSLCGACKDACPVRIPIPELLLLWRQRAVEAGLTSKAEGLGMKGFASMSARPALYRAAGKALTASKGKGLGSLPMVKGWAEDREIPSPSERSFQRQWEEGIE
jgi:L-lactate dehydrogenase complex protein LldF